MVAYTQYSIVGPTATCDKHHLAIIVLKYMNGRRLFSPAKHGVFVIKKININLIELTPPTDPPI